MVANIVLSEIEYTHVGKRPVRPDGVDKVTGRAQYGPDITLRGLLHGKVLRSPYAHVKILAVYVDEARQQPEVTLVMTGTELQELCTGPWIGTLSSFEGMKSAPQYPMAIGRA